MANKVEENKNVEPEVKQEVKQEVKVEPKVEPKQEVKQEVKVEPKVEPKQEVKQEVKKVEPKKYLVKTKVPNYNGIVAGVHFAYGKAEVQEGWILNWFKEKGYIVEEVK